MRALVCLAVLAGGCASVPDYPSPTCESHIYLTTGRRLEIIGQCADGRPLRVIECDVGKRWGCEFRVPAECLVRRLKVETAGEIIRRDDHYGPLAQSWCLWVSP